MVTFTGSGIEEGEGRENVQHSVILAAEFLVTILILQERWKWNVCNRENVETIQRPQANPGGLPSLSSQAALPAQPAIGSKVRHIKGWESVQS